MFVVSSALSLPGGGEVWWGLVRSGDTRKHFPVRRDASRPRAASLVSVRPALTNRGPLCSGSVEWWTPTALGWNYSNVSHRFYLPQYRVLLLYRQSLQSLPAFYQICKTTTNQTSPQPAQSGCMVTPELRWKPVISELGNCEFPPPEAPHFLCDKKSLLKPKLSWNWRECRR